MWSASRHLQPGEDPNRGFSMIVKSSRTFVWSSVSDGPVAESEWWAQEAQPELGHEAAGPRR